MQEDDFFLRMRWDEASVPRSEPIFIPQPDHRDDASDIVEPTTNDAQNFIIQTSDVATTNFIIQSDDEPPPHHAPTSADIEAPSTPSVSDEHSATIAHQSGIDHPSQTPASLAATTAVGSRALSLARNMAESARPDLSDFFRLHAKLLCAASAVAVIGALAGSLVVPIGASASAVLIGPVLPDDLMRMEIAVQRSRNITNAVIDRVGAPALLQCDLLTTPLSLMPTACLNFDGTIDDAKANDIRANEIMRHAMSVSPDDANKSLRLSMLHADQTIASNMLDAAIRRETLERRQIAPASQNSELVSQQEAARQELARIERELAELRVTSNVYDPARELVSANEAEAILADRSADLQQRLSATQAELNKTRDLLRTTPQRIVETQEISRQDPNDSARQVLAQLQLERAHLELAYAPGFQGLVEVKRKIKIAEDTLNARTASRETTARDQRNPVYESLAVTASGLGPRAEGLAAQLLEVQHQHETVLRRIAVLRSFSGRLEALQRRQANQSAVIQDLATNAAHIAAQSANSARLLNDMRWVVESPVGASPRITRILGAAAGATLGFFGCFLMPFARVGFRKFYSDASDAERHLRMPCLAEVSLNTSADGELLPARMIERLFRGIHLPNIRYIAPMVVIHVIGTHRHDGTTEMGRRLGYSIAEVMQRSVLLAELSHHGQEWVESILATDQSAPTMNAATNENADAASDEIHTEIDAEIEDAAEQPPSAAPEPNIQAVAFAHDLVNALIVTPDHVDPDMAMQLQRLRNDHQVLLIISSAESGADVANYLVNRPDITLLMLHSQFSRRTKTANLCARLAQISMPPSGFFFNKPADI